MTNEKPASPTQGELAVKALDWKPGGGDGIMSIRADAIGLRYYIFQNGDDGLWHAYTEGYMMERFGEHKTKDEAKAAVQIGHDRRILSALDRTTLPPTEEGMVLVPKAALDWLNGEGPDDDGVWFGDAERVAGSGSYWWRTVFNRMRGAGRLALPSGREKE